MKNFTGKHTADVAWHPDDTTSPFTIESVSHVLPGPDIIWQWLRLMIDGATTLFPTLNLTCSSLTVPPTDLLCLWDIVCAQH